MDDPVTPVRAILQRCPKQQMQLHYHITDFADVDEFLNLVARGIGKLKRGGIPDQAMAARMVLNDWNMGKIKYYTHPPEVETRCRFNYFHFDCNLFGRFFSGIIE
jgi:nuclear GTP-binding protein